MRAARVELTKWPAHPHRCVDGVLLGEDRYGVWIGNPTGTRLDYAGGKLTSSARVFVLPRDAWWHGRHFTDGGWKLDVTTIPRWRGEHATMSDLDLDVLRNGGRAWIEDEDEFAESLRAGTLPAHFAEPARTTAAQLLHALQAGDEPFASVGTSWLAQLQEIEHTVVPMPAPKPTAVIVGRPELSDLVSPIAILDNYQSAAERLGVKPEACVFIDDRLENVVGAAALGMYGIHHTSVADTVAILGRVLSPAGMLGQKTSGGDVENGSAGPSSQ